MSMYSYKSAKFDDLATVAKRAEEKHLYKCLHVCKYKKDILTKGNQTKMKKITVECGGEVQG